ncbi:hypothetical protein [Altibacter sp. HG106]|uniref:hypothetical protein n=1 Tax=Altibacter sp. HG106 TaxID=3023937 RepID=UPI0023501B25|nr:hypothetical protein [Altibacter sp. HG106]MDC7994221.1 hypothetical protein [Altibacter sp. HG106]
MKLPLTSLYVTLLCCFVLSSCAVDRDDTIAVETFPELVDTDELIAESSETFSMMETITTPTESDLVCIEFIFPFTIVEYDAEGNRLDQRIVNDEEQLLNLLLSIPEGNYINLSFPIMARLDDGTEFVVENKEALEESLSECINIIQDAVIGSCEDIALEKCGWIVMAEETEPPFIYENSVFSDYETGINIYYYRGLANQSSWVFYYIENKLHLNIALENEELGSFWNRDWETTLISDEEGTRFILNDSDGAVYYLVQECDEDAYCDTLTYVECELPDTPNVAEFDLESYLNCIDIITAPVPDDTEESVDFTYSFHELIADAENNENAIDTAVPYQNTSNPQILYVRKTDPDTSEFSVIDITIRADECE